MPETKSELDIKI